ncbi:MAG: PucR family transcriptional regulator [Actinomycetota bacterium]
MYVTVNDLVDVHALGVSMVAGRAGGANPIRFPHISELEDPTPWLSGGELLLTTGMGLSVAAPEQRAYIERLCDAHLSGLGFGIGFRFDEVPAALREAAEAADFPVLEVPYPVPFIAITEAIATRLTEERLKDAQMSVEVHERLTTMISEGAGPADVLDVVVTLGGGWALLFDLKGDVLASAGAPNLEVPASGEVWAGLPPGLIRRRGPTTASEVSPRGTRVALAVLAGKRHEAVLVFGKERKLDQRERIVVRHAVTVLGLLLASRRAVIEAERRIAGDFLNDAFAARLTGPELERRLELVGFRRGAPLAALVLEASPELDPEALEDLAWATDAALGARSTAVRTAVVAGRVAALITHEDAPSVARSLADEVTGGAGETRRLRVGVGTNVDASDIRSSYLSAIFALRAAPPHWSVASPKDLGAYGFLLGAQSRPVLEGFVNSVLGSLIERDRARASDLVASVRAFIASGGRWQQGADALGVHRHTLRYRVRQAEELLGRDLSSAEDRLELWLALKAHEVLDE